MIKGLEKKEIEVEMTLEEASELFDKYSKEYIFNLDKLREDYLNNFCDLKSIRNIKNINSFLK